MTNEDLADLIKIRSDNLKAHIDARFDAVDSRLATMDERLGSIEARVGAVEGRVASLEARATSTEAGSRPSTTSTSARSWRSKPRPSSCAIGWHASHAGRGLGTDPGRPGRRPLLTRFPALRAWPRPAGGGLSSAPGAPPTPGIQLRMGPRPRTIRRTPIGASRPRRDRPLPHGGDARCPRPSRRAPERTGRDRPRRGARPAARPDDAFRSVGDARSRVDRRRFERRTRAGDLSPSSPIWLGCFPLRTSMSNDLPGSALDRFGNAMTGRGDVGRGPRCA